MSDFRARSSSEILDAAFELYRSAFPVFFAINLVAGLTPAANIYLRVVDAPVTRSPGFLIIIALISAAIYPFTSAVTTAAASSVYLAGFTDLVSAARDGLRHPLKVFLAMLLKGLLIVIGFMLLFVPGVVAYKRYFAVPATTVLENTSITGSLSRSTELADGNGLRIFGLVGLTAFFIAIISFMVNLFAVSTHIGIVAGVLYLIVSAAISPFVTIVTVVLYYDIRIRKEAFDIDLMSRAMDAAALTAPTAAPAL